MKVALIMGNYQKQGYPPMGVLYLAAYLRANKPKCQIKVYDVFPDIAMLSEEAFDVIGFSCMSIQYPDVSEYAKKLRNLYGGTIVVGGVHITLTEMLPDWADYAIVGEGEQTLLELIEYLDGNKHMHHIDDISGIIYREEGVSHKTNPRALLEDLDVLPFPAWDLIDMEPYLVPNNVYGTVIGRGLSLMTSRGCVYRCVYCSASRMWQKIRFHSAEYVVNMMEHVIKQYRVEHVWIADDHFALKKSRLYQILELMTQREIHLQMGISCRVESYDHEMSMLLKKLGVKALGLGLETGSDRMLRQIKNGCNVSVAQTCEIVKQMATDGFQIHGMFMINLPGETVEDLEKTVDFIHSLPLSKISVAVATPFYGTEWWDIAVEQGIVPRIPDDDVWRTYNMKTLEDKRPVFKTEIDREYLKKVYTELSHYGKELFYFDWQNRAKL